MAVELSIIIPVSERKEELLPLIEEYRAALPASVASHEVIVVLDGAYPESHERLVEAQANDSALRIVQLARRFGEATALRVGFEQARGRHILTLPAYRQVRPDAIGAVIDGLAEADLVLGVRSRAGDSAWNRLQARGFRGLVRLLTGADFRDLGSGVRAMKRRVLEEVVLYGDRHRFLPIIADRQGFRIHQIDLPQAAEDRFRRGFRPDLYIRRALDVLSVFFLVRFTKKPLRFFGLVGAGLFVVGSLIVCWLVAERLFFGENLADRPALLLSSLMVVLGVQILAIGLIGELIIFTHAPHLKEYQIECIVENGERREPSVVSLLSEEAGAVRRSVGERR